MGQVNADVTTPVRGQVNVGATTPVTGQVGTSATTPIKGQVGTGAASPVTGKGEQLQVTRAPKLQAEQLEPLMQRQSLGQHLQRIRNYIVS